LGPQARPSRRCSSQSSEQPPRLPWRPSGGHSSPVGNASRAAVIPLRHLPPQPCRHRHVSPTRRKRVGQRRSAIAQTGSSLAPIPPSRSTCASTTTFPQLSYEVALRSGPRFGTSIGGTNLVPRGAIGGPARPPDGRLGHPVPTQVPAARAADPGAGGRGDAGARSIAGQVTGRALGCAPP
jgi:hypothetical protein